MSLSRGKIIKIIVQECETVELRYDNYHRDLLEAISEIVDAERLSRIEGRGRIQQKVNDECNKLGVLLVKE